MPAAAGAEWIPEDLGIHMGMPVDKSRAYNESIRINVLEPSLGQAPDSRYAIPDNPNVRAIARQSRAVNNRTVSNG
jgi:hypothetical protein